MTIPNLTLRNGTSVIPLVPSDSYDVITFDTGTPALKSDVADALAAGERVADGDWHEPCERALTIACKGATDEAAEASANALVALMRKHGTVLEVAGSEALSTTIRSVGVQPRTWDATTLIEREQGYIVYDVELVTDPYWYGAEVDASGYTLTAVPSTVAFASIPGEVPALTRLKFTCADDLAATGFLAIGLRSFDTEADASGYDAIDDYSGAADGNALGGAESATLTMTGTWQNIATPPNIDTAANEGRHAVFARVECSAATATVDATTDYRYASVVTGSDGSIGTAPAYGDTTDASLGTGEGFEVVYLGEANVPAGAVPDVATGSGWSTESVIIDNSTDGGTRTLAAADLGTTWSLRVQQTFPSVVRLTKYEFTVDAAPTLHPDSGSYVEFLNAVGSVLARVSHTFVAGLNTVTPPTPLEGVVAAKFSCNSTQDFDIGVAYNHNVYANGALTALAFGGGGDIVSGDDLTFKVYGQTQLGFVCEVEVNALNAGAGTVKHDTDCLIPIDEYACIIAADLGTANRGALIDSTGDAPIAYMTDTSGNFAAIDQATVTHYGSALVWPGDTTYVAVDAETLDGAPGGSDLIFRYRPTYLTPYGG